VESPLTVSIVLRLRELAFESQSCNFGGFYSINYMGVYDPILRNLKPTHIVVDGCANSPGRPGRFRDCNLPQLDQSTRAANGCRSKLLHGRRMRFASRCPPGVRSVVGLFPWRAEPRTPGPPRRIDN